MSAAQPANVTGRPPIDVQKSLLLFLQYMGTEESMSSIGQRFGVTLSHTHNIIHDLLSSIFPLISSEYIKWPSHEQFVTIGSGFQLKSPLLPAVIAGAIDSCEVHIITPKEDPSSYFNRKHYHSIKLQAIVDNNGIFIDIFIGWPGRSHDARAFTNSPIYNYLESNNNALPHDFFIIGDSAYPIKQYLLTPYKHLAATHQQRRFNKALSKARIMVECAFGQLTSRWRRLKFIYMHDMAEICKLVCVACTLHNFCKFENDPNFDVDIVLEDVVNDGPIFAGDLTGSQRRNDLLQLF